MTHPTHDVFNQPEPLGDVNLFRIDAALQAAVSAYGGEPARPRLEAYGGLAGGELGRHGRLANRYPPELCTHDAYGRRIDEVEFHPSYHALMRAAIAHGIHSLPWEGEPGGHVARAALELLHDQADCGTDCPITMTYACIPSLRASPALAAEWIPKILSREYDGRARPMAEKTGVTIGMAMTEKQGGTDVRANTTRAAPLNEAVGGAECYELTGHKWFCSAPMSDAFLTLAQTDEGLGCFLLPRFRPDGSRNAFHLQRLKDKLGNRSNASSEVEFAGAFAWLLGEPGRGVATIIEMVALTRFCCMVGSAAIMRQAMVQVMHHIRRRRVFGRLLIEQPLMRNVAADLMLESEAALWLTLRVAAALDAAERDPAAANLVRLATALGKYWICKRAPGHINEAQECLGGLGYVEENILPRLYREAPVNSIWEGSGNVQCLDMMRALGRTPAVLDTVLAVLEEVRGEHAGYDAALDALKPRLADAADDAFGARRRAERLALLLEARLLIEHTPAHVANAFIRSRLNPDTLAYGGLEDPAAADWLLARLDPG
ncbi:MAG TPA: acyl-CoA dehydrogenase family protein [Pseudomonadales bacterium]